MKNQWKLTSFDLFTLNMTIKGAWIYNEAPDFTKMKEALAELKAMYPHLCGRYVEAEKALVWDDDCAEALQFACCELKDYSVADLVGNPKVWSLVSAYDLKGFKKGSVAPFSAVLGYLKDGAVLFVQCAHATMDGQSFYTLVGQWAALYKGEQVSPMLHDQSLVPAGDALSKEETLRQVQQGGWIRIGFRQLIKMLWNLGRNNGIKTTHVLEVPQAQIAALKEQSGAGANAVLTAIALKAFAAGSGARRSAKCYKLLFVADLRGRITGIGQSFMGNISQPVVAEGLFDPQTETSALAAVIDRSLREALDSGKAEQNLRLSQCSSHHSLPYFYFDASDMNCPDAGTVYINNQLKFRACELDWGTGLPAYAFANELTDMVKFWQPVAGGPVQVIFGGIAGKIMDKN